LRYFVNLNFFFVSFGGILTSINPSLFFYCWGFYKKNVFYDFYALSISFQKILLLLSLCYNAYFALYSIFSSKILKNVGNHLFFFLKNILCDKLLIFNYWLPNLLGASGLLSNIEHFTVLTHYNILSSHSWNIPSFGIILGTSNFFNIASELRRLHIGNISVCSPIFKNRRLLCFDYFFPANTEIDYNLFFFSFFFSHINSYFFSFLFLMRRTHFFKHLSFYYKYRPFLKIANLLEFVKFRQLSRLSFIFSRLIKKLLLQISFFFHNKSLLTISLNYPPSFFIHNFFYSLFLNNYLYFILFFPKILFYFFFRIYSKFFLFRFSLSVKNFNSNFFYSSFFFNNFFNLFVQSSTNSSSFFLLRFSKFLSKKNFFSSKFYLILFFVLHNFMILFDSSVNYNFSGLFPLSNINVLLLKQRIFYDFLKQFIFLMIPSFSAPLSSFYSLHFVHSSRFTNFLLIRFFSFFIPYLLNYFLVSFFRFSGFADKYSDDFFVSFKFLNVSNTFVIFNLIKIFFQFLKFLILNSFSFSRLSFVSMQLVLRSLSAYHVLLYKDFFINLPYICLYFFIVLFYYSLLNFYRFLCFPFGSIVFLRKLNFILKLYPILNEYIITYQSNEHLTHIKWRKQAFRYFLVYAKPFNNILFKKNRLKLIQPVTYDSINYNRNYNLKKNLRFIIFFKKFFYVLGIAPLSSRFFNSLSQFSSNFLRFFDIDFLLNFFSFNSFLKNFSHARFFSPKKVLFHNNIAASFWYQNLLTSIIFRKKHLFFPLVKNKKNLTIYWSSIFPYLPNFSFYQSFRLFLKKFNLSRFSSFTLKNFNQIFHSTNQQRFVFVIFFFYFFCFSYNLRLKLFSFRKFILKSSHIQFLLKFFLIFFFYFFQMPLQLSSKFFFIKFIKKLLEVLKTRLSSQIIRFFQTRKRSFKKNLINSKIRDLLTPPSLIFSPARGEFLIRFPSFFSKRRPNMDRLFSKGPSKRKKIPAHVLEIIKKINEPKPTNVPKKPKLTKFQLAEQQRQKRFLETFYTKDRFQKYHNVAKNVFGFVPPQQMIRNIPIIVNAFGLRNIDISFLPDFFFKLFLQNLNKKNFNHLSEILKLRRENIQHLHDEYPKVNQATQIDFTIPTIVDWHIDDLSFNLTDSMIITVTSQLRKDFLFLKLFRVSDDSSLSFYKDKFRAFQLEKNFYNYQVNMIMKYVRYFIDNYSFPLSENNNYFDESFFAIVSKTYFSATHNYRSFKNPAELDKKIQAESKFFKNKSIKKHRDTSFRFFSISSNNYNISSFLFLSSSKFLSSNYSFLFLKNIKISSFYFGFFKKFKFSEKFFIFFLLKYYLFFNFNNDKFIFSCFFSKFYRIKRYYFLLCLKYMRLRFSKKFFFHSFFYSRFAFSFYNINKMSNFSSKAFFNSSFVFSFNPIPFSISIFYKLSYFLKLFYFLFFFNFYFINYYFTNGGFFFYYLNFLIFYRRFLKIFLSSFYWFSANFPFFFYFFSSVFNFNFVKMLYNKISTLFILSRSAVLNRNSIFLVPFLKIRGISFFNFSWLISYHFISSFSFFYFNYKFSLLFNNLYLLNFRLFPSYLLIIKYLSNFSLPYFLSMSLLSFISRSSFFYYFFLRKNVSFFCNIYLFKIYFFYSYIYFILVTHLQLLKKNITQVL